MRLSDKTALKRPRIGLLGGSFNPAHAGHIQLSLEAKKRLKLNIVIWLLTPQNPLKSKAELADYATRLTYARKLVAPYSFIHISTYEADHHCRYSLQTIRHLQTHNPRTKFIWLMGADNLHHFHRWRDWQEILHCLPVAVFDRAPFSHAALRRKAALCYAQARYAQIPPQTALKALTPCWSYYFMRQNPLSASELRKILGENAFSMA